MRVYRRRLAAKQWTVDGLKPAVRQQLDEIGAVSPAAYERLESLVSREGAMIGTAAVIATYTALSDCLNMAESVTPS